jgi:N4-gp56 family major capsid protein
MATFTWVVDAPTGVFKSHAMSKKLREQALEKSVFMDHVSPVDGFGRRRGETVTLTRLASLTEPTSAVLDENMRIPEDTLDLSTTPVTVQELGRSVPFTSLADDLSEFDLRNPVQKRLRDQLTLVLDTLAATQYKATYVKAIPTGTAALTWDTDGTASTSATANVNLYHLGAIRDYLFGTLLAPMIDGRYIGIFHTNGLRGIKNDPDRLH